MMGFDEVHFAGSPPSIYFLHREISKLTGLQIECIDLGKESWLLKCVAEAGVAMQVVVAQIDKTWGITHEALHKYNAYLLNSLLHVLIESGGHFEEEPFPWQGKSWAEFRRSWNGIYVISSTM
ncbi:hypothetical protein F0P96_09735 [Hymenobacter busanensis]|uniref:Uncharacterized protein n=1 Tax=Hymenobacter busanensis TaxID=2607656 RepID=A0A7L4ZX45_9BACT|nr:hypothetical protein [Hymenobacter busanensis]KAA9333249.1 hypothetical protein F0P96_09735 [Hymenobacter busanensis]QHJ08074.1 hypothetical protein GUY19_12585 [Hymenobacter busanensis]